ncbi:hypothetical protein NC981_20285 [Leptolyngbya sp. DQ-M1]|uniref:hypothetical protein n=1 Tax=Leptolyngbya sp. DQ-M1 TaxID=2933920 RepID=UPI0032993DB6
MVACSDAVGRGYAGDRPIYNRSQADKNVPDRCMLHRLNFRGITACRANPTGN